MTRARERARLGVAAGVQMQRAAARRRRGRAARRRAPVARMTRAVDRWVSRSHASITQPVKQPRVGCAADRDVERPARANGPTAAAARSARGRDAAAAPTQRDPRAREQQPVAREARRGSRATPRSRRTSDRGGGQRGARVLHEVAELHAGRARGLAAAARHALVHRGAERVVDRRVAAPRPRASPRCGRAATRSRARSRGTSGSAAGTARTRRTRSSSSASRPQRPGHARHRGHQRQPARVAASRRVERVLDAAHQRRRSGAGTPKPSSSVAPPASRSSQPPCACATGARARERAGVVGRDVHRADAELRAPAHVGRRARARTRATRAGRDRDAAAVRARPGSAGAASTRRRGRAPARRRRPRRLRAAPSRARRPTAAPTAGRRASASEPVNQRATRRPRPAAQRHLQRARRACRTSRRTGAGRS